MYNIQNIHEKGLFKRTTVGKLTTSLHVHCVVSHAIIHVQLRIHIELMHTDALMHMRIRFETSMKRKKHFKVFSKRSHSSRYVGFWILLVNVYFLKLYICPISAQRILFGLRSLSLSLSLSSLSPPLFLSPSLSLAHSLSLSFSLSRSFFLSLSLARSLSLFRSFSLSLSLSLSLYFSFSLHLSLYFCLSSLLFPCESLFTRLIYFITFTGIGIAVLKRNRAVHNRG